MKKEGEKELIIREVQEAAAEQTCNTTVIDFPVTYIARIAGDKKKYVDALLKRAERERSLLEAHQTLYVYGLEYRGEIYCVSGADLDGIK